MLEDDGYGKLGFISNAVVYLALALGSLGSTGIINKIGERKSMAVGAMLCVPSMADFAIPAMRENAPND